MRWWNGGDNPRQRVGTNAGARCDRKALECAEDDIVLVHDAVHRWRLGDKSWMRNHRLRHHRHHRSPVPGNFGVTTGFWDVVFGTEIVPERTRGPRLVSPPETPSASCQ